MAQTNYRNEANRTGKVGGEGAVKYVIRGGHWDSPDNEERRLRTGHRSSSEVYDSNNKGFRLVKKLAN